MCSTRMLKSSRSALTDCARLSQRCTLTLIVSTEQNFERQNKRETIGFKIDLIIAGDVVRFFSFLKLQSFHHYSFAPVYFIE